MATLFTRQIGKVTDAVYVTGGGGTGTGSITLNLVCTYTQNTTNNTSTVTLQVKAVASNANLYFKVGSWAITGNGPTGSGGESAFAYDSRNFASKSKTLTHGSSGNTSFSSGATATLTYYNSVGTTATKSFTLSNVSYSLPTINVYSTIAFSSTTPTMGDTVTMTITKANVATSGVKITASYDSTTVTVYEGTGTSTTWVVPNLATTTTTAEAKSITIAIQSVKGSTYYQAKQYTLTAQVPSSYVPSITIGTITDNLAAITPFVIGYSKLTVPVTGSVSSDGGATIVSYALEVRETNASGAVLYTASTTSSAASQSYTMSSPITTATTYVKATITDSRGRTATATTTVSASAYTKPSISITAERCDSGGTASQFGTYAKITVTWSIAALTGNTVSGNVITYKSTGGAYSSVNSKAVTGTSGTYNFILSGIAVNTAAWFYTSISDQLETSVSSVVSVQKAIMPFSLYDDGTNVGATVGQIASEKGFHVYLETEHRNHFVAPQISAGNTAVGGYTVLCTFTITGTNMNQPVYLRVICRNRWYPYDISIRWWNEANTDPGFAYMFASSRYDLFYMYKVSTSTWQLLVYNQLTYENFAISDVQIGGYNSSKITVDYPASTYAAATVYPSLPGVLDTDVFGCKSWSEFSGRANSFDAIDLNTMTQAGCYSISNGVNTPTGSPHGMLIVIENTATNIKQIFMGTTTLDCYRMTYDGGTTWYGWYEYDVIVAEGTSGNWRYRKYASGKSECWKNVIGNVAITTAYSGGFYRSAAIGAEDFPSGLFIQNPSVLATVSNNNGVSIFCSGVQYQSNTRMDGVFNIHVGSGTYSCINAFYVVGKWK